MEPRAAFRHDRAPGPPRQARDPLRLAGAGLLLLGLLLGVFVVPYLVPSPATVLSAATLAHYNTPLAYALYLGLLLCSGVACARLLRATPGPGPRPVRLDPGVLRLLPTRVVWLVLLGHVLLFAALYQPRGYLSFGDAMYFQPILARMVSGQMLYRDVNFLYGPAMAYPPVWLGHFMSLTAAYAVYYVAMYLLGLYLLYLCLQAVAGSGREADLLFVWFALGLFNALLGLNYVLTRHLLPVVTLLAAWWHLEQPSFRLGGPGGVLLPIGLLLLTLLFSLEMGILTVAGLVVLCGTRMARAQVLALLGWMGRSGQERGGTGPGEISHLLAPLGTLARVGLICALPALLLLLTFYLIDPSLRALLGYLQPTLTYSSGGGSTRIDPSLPVLALLGTGLLGLTLMLAAAGGRDFARVADLALGLLGLGLLMQRAAFGKPDAPHLAYCAMPMVLFVLAFLHPRLGPRPSPGQGWKEALRSPRARYCLAVGLGLMLPLQVFNGLLFEPFLASRLHPAERAATRGGPGAQTGKDQRTAIHEGLSRLVLRLGLERTYYLHNLGYYSLPLVLKFGLRQVPYFTTRAEVFTRDDVDLVIRELRESGAVVICRPQDLLPPSYPSYEGWQDLGYRLLGAPMPGTRVFVEVSETLDLTERPLLDHLRSAYDVAMKDDDANLVALVPRTDN